MTAKMRARHAGVMGWPVKHSRSPRLHGYWLNQYGIDGDYGPLPVPPEEFAQALAGLAGRGFIGVNLTVPHKEAALGLVDRLEPLAKRIGAVNTIVVRGDGTLEGRNTDAFGFMANLRQSAPAWQAKQGPAIVLGAGGAARAALCALIEAGAPEIRLLNRTTARAEILAAEIDGPVRVRSWTERTAVLADAALLVNTTTLGMTGQPPLDLALDRLPKTATVNDIVYAPLETGLLAAARARGNGVVDGLGMLLHQGRPAFQAWFGVDPEVTPELRAYVAEGLA
ncbi:MAG: shikimate dehydrogenase [Rhodospirillales bacterium]|nr:shikimate dehydrogenase [Rhodospirillales bacterium]